MQNLKIGNMSKDEIYNLIKDRILGAKVDVMECENPDDLHHNSPYTKMQSIVEYGILSIDEMYRLGLRKDNIQAIDNANGQNCISVSKVEYYNPQKDFFYDSKMHALPRFVIDSSLYAIRRIRRNSVHYSNEFLVEDSIPVKYIKAIEERFLDYIKIVRDNENSNLSLDSFIENYNAFIDALQYMIENNIDIPIIDGSLEEGIIIDKQKMLSYGKITK